MSVLGFENHDPNKVFYNMKDALYNHVKVRSEKAFEDAKAVRANIKSKEELCAYAENMRNGFIKSLGGIPYDNSLPLNAKTTNVIEEDDLVIENVIFEARPSVYVTANLYLPKQRKEKCGAVLFQLGHSDEGKTCAQYQRVARAIASCGVIVMVMDPVGQGERWSYYEKELNNAAVYATTTEHDYAGIQCVLTGDSIARYFIADAMRAVDYLVSRPEVDGEKIGATGSSGGGTATCHAMICDPRIKAAAPGTFVTTRHEYYYSGNAQDAEQIWLGATKAGFDHHEVLMCFAPKPLLILTVASDFFPVEGADEVYEDCKRFWDMHGAGDKLGMERDESLHEYTDKLAMAAGEFFARELNGEEKVADKTALKSIDKKLLNCTPSGQVRVDFPDAKFVFHENLERFNSLDVPEDDLKTFLTKKMNFNREEVPVRLRTFTPVLGRGIKAVPHMWFAQKYMPNHALMLTAFGKTPTETVICLWDKGTNDIEGHIHTIRKLCKEGKAVFVLDLAGVGKCAPVLLNTAYSQKGMYGVLDRLNKDLFFLDDSLCAIRLFELNYAVKMLREEFNTKVSIIAGGVSESYARLYGYIDTDMEITLEDNTPTYSDIVKDRYFEEYNIQGTLIPGIARYFK